MLHGNRIAAFLCAAVFTSPLLLRPHSASAADRDKPPVGIIEVRSTTDEPKAKGHPVMVSIVSDGRIVRQEEVELGHSSRQTGLPLGTYDVRLEAEGFVTLVKRGIQVTENTATNVIGPMRPGQGVHIVEYATGGLTREELANRLERMEATIARLEARLGKSAKDQ